MTGATGLVGSRFVEMYKDKYEIYNMDLTTPVDITSLKSVQDFVVSHRAPALIHLAAFTNTAQAAKETGDKEGICYKVNVLGTQNMVKVCQKYNIHLVHISTDFVFDGQKQEPYTEEDKRNPLDWYGETKRQAEEIVEVSNIDYTILRIAYPYRKTYDLKPDIVKKIREGLAKGDLPPQFSDTVITPTFTDDIARSFDKIIDSQSTGIYHIVGDTSLSPFELAKKVASTFGFDENMVKEGSLTDYLTKNPRPFARYAALSNKKATEELELSFATIEEGLKAIAE